MNIAYSSPRSPGLWRFLAHGIAGLFVALLLALSGAAAHAATPPAGALVSNQASATYSDGSGVSRTVTSNLVQTTVTQVYSLTLASSGAQNATAGSVVYYPHTVKNTGNGTDTFNLSASSGTTQFTMSNVLIYADNGSGQPTGSPISATGALPAGASFNFIVQGTVPAGATAGQTNAITVTATSVGDNTKTASNTDTTTVTTNAVVTLTKGINVASGAANSGPYTYTLSYTNTGNSDATAVAISDVIPAGMTYVAGSARWSVTGSTALSDGGGTSGSSPNTLTSSYTSGTRTFLATIDKVAAGQSGWISFQVTVNPGVAPGAIPNTGTLSYNNGAATVTGSSNTVSFTVTQTAAVSLTGQTIPAGSPAAAGSTVTFTNVVTNNGNGTDTFNIKLANSNTFPVGTSFQLYKSDGVTPLVDTNGDGTIDTGPVAANGTYNVIVKATLPPNANGAGPFATDLTATSVFDATKSQTATDQLTTITSASVDLTNNTAGGPGANAGPEGTAQVTNSTNPGTTTVFTLVAKNTGTGPDSYDLAASTASNFSSLTVPAGWTVAFKADGGAGNCSSTGATIANTGNVAAGGTVTVCAIVSIPTNYDAGTVDLYFRTLSPTSAASDRLHDAVTISAVRLLTLAPNGAGQVAPGGLYVYTHTLTNNGNVTEGSTFSTMTPSINNGGTGWTATLYYDTNGNGVLDSNDQPVSGSLAITLAKGQSVTLFNKVIAPSGAAPGTVNPTQITINTANGSYTSTVPAATVSTDSTTVIAGNLSLTKLQGLDLDCNGVLDNGASFTQSPLSAKPGQCILYQITVSNSGTADATSVVVSDGTPAYTTISTAAATTSGQVTGPAVGAAGTINAYVGSGATSNAGGTLAAGQSAVITFGVKINP